MLPRSQRLRVRRDFRIVYSKGRSLANPWLVLYSRVTKHADCRIGFSISKKLGGAVERNRIKRRLREIMRSHSAKLRPGWDVVIVGRSRLQDADFQAIAQSVHDLLQRARLLTDAGEKP